MGKKEKLQHRFKAQPKDFTWLELCSLLKGLGFETLSGAGSRYKFFNKATGCMINLHRPHPKKILKQYVMRDVLQKLTEDGLL